MGIRAWVAAFLAVFLLAAAPAQAQKILHRGNGSEPETLDPHKSTGEPEGWIQYDLFEGLMTVDGAGNLIPGAAESYTVSPDGLTYTFKLRDTVWSDGTPVTAEDFAFSWRRLLDPKTGSRYAFFLWPVKNAEKANKGELPLDRVGVAAPDPRTFVVTLEAPTSYFASALQHNATYAISKKSYEKHGEDFIKPGNLVSNGAFMLAEAVPQGYVRVRKNPRYWDAANVRLDEVVFHATENKDTELKRFRAGELHITYDVPDPQIPWLKQNMPAELRIAPFFSTYYYAFNLTREPWKSNPDLRKALALALDRTIITEKITLSGEVPAYQLVPDGTANYASPKPDWAGWTQAQRDAEAKRLVEKAGYGKGGKPLELELFYNTSENHKKVAVAVASMWQQKLGVRTTLNNQEWKVFLQTRSRKQYNDIALGRWIGDYNDAYTFLGLFLSDLGPSNYSGYASPEYDRLVRTAASEVDTEKRRDLLQRAEAVLLADLPIIPVYVYTTQNMVSTRVKGWVPNIRNLHPSRFLELQ